MATLKKRASLAECQTFIKDICAERGWNKNNHLELFLLFSEEVGELAKAIRKHTGLYAEAARSNQKHDLEEEFADVLSYLLDLANFFDIDLEKALRDKQAANEQRVWE